MIKSWRNQMANITNPYQTKTKRVLAVCSAGLLRSPTTANVLHQEFGYNTRACGTSQDFALIPLSEALLYWADEIVFVNPDNFNSVNFSEVKEILKKKRVIVLDLPDEFNWNDDGLKQAILDQYNIAEPVKVE